MFWEVDTFFKHSLPVNYIQAPSCFPSLGFHPKLLPVLEHIPAEADKWGQKPNLSFLQLQILHYQSLLNLQKPLVQNGYVTTVNVKT